MSPERCMTEISCPRITSITNLRENGMGIHISSHAKRRMKTYGLSEKVVLDTIKNPDKTLTGYAGRLIAQKNINRYMLRAVYEKVGERIIVVTVYPAEKGRY